jgi:hypothetical protein
MLTVTRVFYFATVVTIGILLAIVAQAKVNEGEK